MRNLYFQKKAFDDIRYWLRNDRKMLARIFMLIDEILSSPFNGKGKPEPLKYELQGLWSRRIDKAHRIIYSVTDENIIVHSCRYHYDE